MDRFNVEVKAEKQINVTNNSTNSLRQAFIDDGRQRFPRLSKGEQLFYVSLIAWGFRRTIIRERKGHTEVLFRIPASRIIRRTRVFGGWFDKDNPKWIASFEKTFYQTVYSGKLAHRYLDVGLKSIYTDAIKNFCLEAVSPRSRPHVEKAIRKFETLDDSTNSNRPPAVAVSLAARYRYLLGRVKSIRVYHNNAEIDQIVPAEKAKLFLKMVNFGNVYDAFHTDYLSPRDLTLEILRWELRRKGLKYKRRRIEEYIALGGKMLASLGKHDRETFDQSGRSRISIPRIMPRGLKPRKRQSNDER